MLPKTIQFSSSRSPGLEDLTKGCLDELHSSQPTELEVLAGIFIAQGKSKMGLALG